MRILPQLAPLSYSLLPEPAPMLMLPAPQLAGLLPAPQITVIKQKPPQSKSRSRIFRTPAEWQAADAELAAWIEGAIERINAANQGVVYA
jgi:hypothetical protein